MSYTPIPRGTTDWNVPVNAAFTDQDERITVLETARAFALKTADESVTNSAAYQNDDELFVPVTAGGTYIVEGYIVYDTTSEAGINLRMTGPTGTGLWTFFAVDASGGTTSSGPVRTKPGSNNSGAAYLGGSGGDMTALLRGTFLPTADGTLTFEWSQNAASTTATIVRANSWLSVQKVG